MDHSKIRCACIWEGDIYKAPEQHAPRCPVYRHMEEAIAGTCLDCKGVDESEGSR